MDITRKIVVIGATPNSDRYGYIAVERLLKNNFPVVPVGIKKGNINGLEIQNGTPEVKDVHTVTLYINPEIQKNYYHYILDELQPRRIIFNPGTENIELEEMAEKKGIETLEACTLTLLSIGAF